MSCDGSKGDMQNQKCWKNEDTINIHDSSEYVHSPNCDNPIRTVDGHSCEQVRKNEHEKDLLVKDARRFCEILGIHSQLIFVYLYHLASFSWQRRKRRCGDMKVQRNYSTGLIIYKYVLLCLVLSSSLLAPINATASASPAPIKFPSQIQSSNVTPRPNSHFRLPPSTSAKLTLPYILESYSYKDKSRALTAPSPKSGIPKGNK